MSSLESREQKEDVRSLFRHMLAIGVSMPLSGVHRLIREHGLDEATDRIETMAEAASVNLCAGEYPAPEGEQRA